MAAPRRRRLVLMLDSLDEVPREHVALLSWLQLNGFEEWDVRLIVTCRQEHIHGYCKNVSGRVTWKMNYHYHYQYHSRWVLSRVGGPGFLTALVARGPLAVRCPAAGEGPHRRPATFSW